MTQPRTPKSVSLEIFRHLFTALSEEMGATLRRTSFSPNIKERRDYSCALFDSGGAAVSLGDHMPVHLGAMPMSVEAALDEVGELAAGDIVCLNDPFKGGPHLPDITLISSVHGARGKLLGHVASRAHHSDVGGSTPGSMPLAQEIFEEGIRIPPVRLYEKGQLNTGLWNTLLANVRTPVERAGDLDAQVAALHSGQKRLREIAQRKGTEETLKAMTQLIEYADQLVEAGLAMVPDGFYEAEDWIEDDGFGSGPIPIRASLNIKGARLTVDFEGTSPQVPGGVNAVAAITSSATRYVVRCIVEALLKEPLPAGGGSMSMVKLVLPPKSIVNADPPASVAAGNVETSQRITDVLLQAFSLALPDYIPAMSQGTMNNMTVGGIDPRDGESFAYYETVGGGMGAGPTGAGLSGVHCHMSNSLNTPIEALEHAYPYRVTHYSIRRNSGGAGRYPGGDGLRRDLMLLVPAKVSLLSERRVKGPPGTRGGNDGTPGDNILISNGIETRLPGKKSFTIQPGDTISIRSPGGGGWGTPMNNLGHES